MLATSSESAAFLEKTEWLSSDITRNSSLSAAWFSEKEEVIVRGIRISDNEQWSTAKRGQSLLSTLPRTRKRMCRHFQDTSSRQAAYTDKDKQLRTDPGELKMNISSPAGFVAPVNHLRQKRLREAQCVRPRKIDKCQCGWSVTCEWRRKEEKKKCVVLSFEWWNIRAIAPLSSVQLCVLVDPSELLAIQTGYFSFFRVMKTLTETHDDDTCKRNRMIIDGQCTSFPASSQHPWERRKRREEWPKRTKFSASFRWFLHSHFVYITWCIKTFFHSFSSLVSLRS